jgi:hypothetical protein
LAAVNSAISGATVHIQNGAANAANPIDAAEAIDSTTIGADRRQNNASGPITRSA